jgi:hypothetical protein
MKFDDYNYKFINPHILIDENTKKDAKSSRQKV